MSNELQIYKFAPNMNLRTVVIDGEPLYIAKDVVALMTSGMPLIHCLNP